MYTQHSKMKLGQVVGLADGEAAPTVRLLSQGADHKVTFQAPGEAPVTVPSHEFFGCYREAYPDDSAAAERAFKRHSTAAAKDDAKEPAPAK